VNGRSFLVVLALFAAGCAGPATPPKTSAQLTPLASGVAAPEGRIGLATRDYLLVQENHQPKLGEVAELHLRRAAKQVRRQNVDRGLKSALALHLLMQLGDDLSKALGPHAASAVRTLSREYAKKGNEAGARAMYRLLADPNSSLAVSGDERNDAAGHLAALEAHSLDLTKTEGIAVPAERRARLATGKYVYFPTTQNKQEATRTLLSWADSAIRVRSIYQATKLPPSSAEQFEANRGLTSSSAMIVAVHLRAFDPQGALKAIDGQMAAQLLHPMLHAQLKQLASGGSYQDWLQMARSLSANGDAGGGPAETEGESSLGPDGSDIFLAASLACTLQAVRLAPEEPGPSFMLASRLLELGVTEVVPHLVVPAATSASAKRYGADVLDGALSLSRGALMTELEQEEFGSARRILAAMNPLLGPQVDGSPIYRKSVLRVLETAIEIELQEGDLKAASARLRDASGRGLSAGLDAIDGKLKWQAGDIAGAQKAFTLALARPEIAQNPLQRAEINMEYADLELERGDGASARRILLDAWLSASTFQPQGASSASNDWLTIRRELTLARISDRFSAKARGNESLGRAFAIANRSPSSMRTVMGYAASRALALDDVALGRDAVSRGLAAGLDANDCLYPLVWLRLLEQQTGISGSEFERTLRQALDSDIDAKTQALLPDSPWGKQVAYYILFGRTDLKALAKNAAERTEAIFYTAARKRAFATGGQIDQIAPWTKSDLDLVMAQGGLELSEFTVVRRIKLAQSSNLLGNLP
jgi:hypothetical protein